MPKKKPVSTKRGQHHQYKSFWINLIKDINLTKIDANVIRKHQDSFEKKKVRLEKRNSDPQYLRQTVLQEFQSLCDGVEFSFWRLSKDNPTLIPLPPEIDNAASLCNYDELNRSSLYIRLQAPPHFVTPSTSSTQPHQILELMDSTEQQADESLISQETSALQVVTDVPGDDVGKKQILNQSSWIVTHELGPDGELLLLPMRQASSTAVSITMQPTASVIEEALANKGEMLELLAKEKSVDRGGEHSSRVPKKRKITTETGQNFMGAKQYQRSSAQERDLTNEHIADFWNRDNLISFSSTVQANGVPSADAMDNDTDVVPGQFTQDVSDLFNYQHQQLLIDNSGFSSSLTNFNYHENRDQPQPMLGLTVPQTYTLQTKDSGAWDLGQRSMALPYPLHASCRSNFTDPSIGLHTSYPFNVNDPITTPVRQNMQYPCQQRPNAADAGHSIQQHLDSRMPQPQQSLIGLDMVSQNSSSSENTCLSQENASNVSKFLHAQLLGEIKFEYVYTVLGIAAMNDKLYIVYKNKVRPTVLIRVYSSNSPFQKEKEFRVNRMKYPHRIQAYAEKNCLFISDGEDASPKCIWMVTDGDEVVCKKLVEDIKCCSLSVTREGELLIVDIKHKCLHFYKSDGRCFNCVKLPNKINSDARVYAVKSPRESFYVNAVWTGEYKKMTTLYSMVYEVSKDGDIVKTFGGRIGRGAGQLSESNHPMAVDKYGRLIVGDEGNKRILMLDSNLQLLTIVLEKDDLTHNFRYGVDFNMGANAGLLFALGNWGQDISVFTLSQSEPNLMIESSNNISSKAMPGKDEFHLLFSIERHTCKEIRGIATLMDSIYVLYRYSITVYDGTNPYTKKYKQYYDEGDLWDIAANVSDGCLYVTDKERKCVWSVGVDLRQKTWLEGIGSPYTLSVAKDGSVLILSNKDQSLNIYYKDVHLLKQIRFSCRNTMHLQHAVQLSYSRGNETYLVCHGLNINHAAVDDYDYDSDFLSHEVFVVSGTGDIIQTFGGKFGSNLDQLNLPSHIVFYRDSTILVADCNNNRVLRLDHQLNLRNIPLNMDVHGIEEPFRLCYSENTGQMIVANSNSVDIFANDDFIRCPGEDEQSSSDSAVNTDASESEMPYVLLIGQVDIQMQKDKVCRGAAVLQGRLYLIYKGVDTVYVHSSDHPYETLSQIVRQEMKNPWHIVASVEHNCVYITARSTIWRLVRNGQECETFLSFECVCSISVNEEGHLLVATKDDIEEPSYVRTYDADGRCIQVIEFCLYRNISYAVQSGAKKVFVNWSCFGENENCKAMSEVSLNGVLLHTYGPHINEFFKCRGMSLGEGDQVFVIDKSNGGRILVFGSRARLIGVLMGKDDHQMTKIAGLCYIKDKKQLLVIGSDRINVYQLNKNRGPQIDGYCRKEALEEEDPVLCNRHGDTGQLLYSRKVYYEQGQLSLRAVGELGEKQYLLYSNSLEVFSRKDFVTKTDFEREARKIPEDRPLNFSEAGLWDMAASEIDLCLYVTDRYNHCVWSVSIDHKIKKWLTGIGSPYTLSVTEDGSLCILSNDYKHLHVYDRSGRRTKSIELPRHMRYLLHAVQTPKGTYIISWTGNVKYDGIRRNGNDFVKENSDTKKDYEEEEEERWFLDHEDVVFEERHKGCVCSEESETRKRGLVCEISSDGSILRSFSANDPQHDQIGTFDSRYLFKLEKPCHLALDHEGRVFVADYHGSGRVLLLDTQLKFLANLTENFHREGYKAKRLCYDKSNKELTVIQYHCHDYTIIGIRVQCQ